MPIDRLIGGHVTLDGSPLGGVTVTLTRPDSSTETATTDTAGYYSFADLTPGSDTVAPLHPRFTFTPQSSAVVLSGANRGDVNFEASASASGAQPVNGPVLIREFRLSGVTTEDEFVELYNNTDAEIDISGYQLEAVSGEVVTVPANTLLPARSHYLIARRPEPGSGYTLSHYAAPDLT